MAKQETGGLCFCWSWAAPSTYFALMTSLLIATSVGLSTNQSIPFNSQGMVNYTISSNQTKTKGSDCVPCTKTGDSATSVGVIVGSAIAGALIGGLLTAVVMTCLRNRSLSPPPKDYDGMSEQTRFDVNRNDDVILTNGGDSDEGNINKTHKKLERLVQRNPYQTGEMAAVPLIHNTDSSSDVTNEQAAPKGKTQDPSAAVQGPASDKSNERVAPISSARRDGAGEAEEGDSGYLNVGDKSALEQPYDSLAVVPEEVEYENHKENVYEAILEGKHKNTTTTTT